MSRFKVYVAVGPEFTSGATAIVEADDELSAAEIGLAEVTADVPAPWAELRVIRVVAVP